MKSLGFGKKLVGALALVAGLLTSGMAWAEEFALQYNDKGTEVVSFTGTCPSEITANMFSNTCVSIGYEAFKVIDYYNYRVEQLTKVTLPDSITNIGTRAFVNCTNLSAIVCSDPTKVHAEYHSTYNPFTNTKVFWLHYSNGALVGYTLPRWTPFPAELKVDAGCGIIWSGVFNCQDHNELTNLVKVTLPASVTNIGYQAFYDCDNLTTVECKGNQHQIHTGYNAFSGTKVFWPLWYGSTRNIRGKDCEYLPALANVLVGFQGAVPTKLEIPEGTERIGMAAFSVLSYESYDKKAYASLTNVTEVVIPESVKQIDAGAFFYCPNLANVTFKGNVDDITFGTDSTDKLYGSSVTDGKWFGDVFEGTKYFFAYISKGEGEGNGKVLRDIDGPCPTTYAIPEGVVEISGKVFSIDKTNETGAKNLTVTNLTAVTIPSTVTYIGEEAFFGCENLADVIYTGRTADNGNVDGITYGSNVFTGTKVFRLLYADSVKRDTVTGFEGTCPATITFPAGVKTINSDFAASNASSTNLVAITVPEKFESFGSYAFNGCENLATVNFTGDIRDLSFDQGTFAGTKVYMPHYTAHSDGGFILDYFSGTCPANVVVPDYVREISEYAFAFGQDPSVTNMVSLTLSEGLVSIYANAFNGCENLKEVNIPTSVKIIGDNAFANCTYLAKVTGGEYPGGYATGTGYTYNGAISRFAFDNTIFRNGDKIVNFGLGDDDYIKTNAEAAVAWTNKMEYYNTHLELVQVCDTVIGTYGNLTQAVNQAGLYVTNWNYKVTIPEGVRAISAYAFYGLAITEVDLPDSLECIGGYAFNNCRALQKVNGGNNLKCITSAAFSKTRFSYGDVWFDDYRMDKMDEEALADLDTAIRNGQTNFVVSVGGIVIGTLRYALADYDDVKYINADGTSSWTYELVIPEGTRIINEGVFSSGNIYEASGVTSVVLPDTLQAIGAYAFNGCENLETVKGNVANLEYLGESAFYGTKYLAADEYDSEEIAEENEKGLELIMLGDTIVGVRGSLAEAYDANGELVDGWEYELVITNGVRAIAKGWYDDATGEYRGVFSGLPITSIVIPDTMETIGSYAFQNCTYLKKLDLGEGVMSIGNYAFENAGSYNGGAVDEGFDERISRVELPASLTKCNISSAFSNFGNGNVFFNGTPVLDELDSADYNYIVWKFYVGENGTLSSAYMQFWTQEQIVEKIGKDKTIGFEQNHDGSSIYYVRSEKGVLTIPEGVVEIDDYVTFYSIEYDSVALQYPVKKIVLPSTLKKIGYYVFNGWAQLETVEGGANVEEIEWGAFGGTKFLNGSVWYDYNMGRIDADSEEYKAYINGYEPVVWNGFLLGFRGELAEKNEKDDRNWVYNTTTEEWDYVGSYALTIPEGVKAFRDGVSVSALVTDLTIPGSLTTIEADIFSTKYLKTLTLGEGIEEIKDGAFEYAQISELKLPESMLYVGRLAFANCANLKSVTIGSCDTVINSSAFLSYYTDDLNEYSGLDTFKICLSTNLTTIAFAQEGYELVGWNVATDAEVLLPYWVEGSLDQSKFGEYTDVLKAFDTSYWKDGYLWSYAIAPIVKHTALWAKDTEVFTGAAAEQYNGYIRDAEGNVIGTITLKTKKVKSGSIATATATIAVMGAKKTTVKGNIDLETGVFASDSLNLKITGNGMSGKYGTSDVVGAQNKFVSKDADDKAIADAVLAQWKGNYAMAFVDDAGMNTLQIAIVAKGKVTIKGTLADGTTISTSAQMLIGADNVCNIPVVYEKKSVKMGFTLWLSAEGYEIEGYEGAVFGASSDLGTNEAFYVDSVALAKMLGDDTYADLYPNGYSVETTGKKWVVAYGVKAGSDGNLASLKLTYTKKSGSFKGSFNGIYAKSETAKGKKSVKVAGVVIDGVGYGTAYIKKAGAATVLIH